MKLTLNRREEQEKKLFKTLTVYYLDIKLEATPEEMALIKKHQWDKWVLVEVMPPSGSLIQWKVGAVLEGYGRENRYTSVEELAHAESQVIETAKKLKQQLEAAAGFTSAGPREIEL